MVSPWFSLSLTRSFDCEYLLTTLQLSVVYLTDFGFILRSFKGSRTQQEIHQKEDRSAPWIARKGKNDE